MDSLSSKGTGLLSVVFPWPLVQARSRGWAWVASGALLLGVLASRLLLLPDGPWEQDEALIACGVVDFDPAHHMPLPPGFPLWVLLGRLVHLLGATDPLVALQVASAVLSVLVVWASVGLWDRLMGRAVALTGAMMAAFLPGVWFHAARGFSGMAATALAVTGLALWLRAGGRGFVPGTVVLTAAALVRPPLAPFLVVAVLLASWGVRRRPRRLLAGASAATAVMALVLFPMVQEAGGWRLFWSAGTTHAVEHLALLGTEPSSLADLGFVRGLGTPVAAVVLAVLAAIGWIALARRLGWRWWAGSLAAAWLLFLLLALHNRTYPRYWLPVWIVAAPLAVHAMATLTRSRVVAAGVAAIAAGVGAWWSLPAMAWVHSHALPPVAALRIVAAENRGALVFDDGLFSFRNLAARQGSLEMGSMRVTEIPPRRLAVGGDTVWFLTGGPGLDAPAPVSRVFAFLVAERRVTRLSQERFLEARLVRNPVLVWRGGSIPEYESTRRFVWCARRSLLLLPPLTGGGAVTLGIEVHHLLGEVELVARVAGVETLRERVAGRRLVTIPIPALPRRNRLLQVVPVELETDGEIELPGDRRSLSLRIFSCSLEAPPYVPPPYTVFADPGTLLSAAVSVSGTHLPELVGDPPRPATWLGPEARFSLPLGEGRVAVELLAPRPGPVPTTVALGSASTELLVGAAPVRVVLPVPRELAHARRGELIVRSETFVPGPGDPRELGVALHAVSFIPDPLAGAP